MVTHEKHRPLSTINTLLVVALTATVAIFLLVLAVRLGSGIVDVLQPESADAAPIETATPTAEATSAPPAAAPTQLPPTPVPPTPTQTAEPTPMPTPEPTPVPATPEPPRPRAVAGANGVNVRRGPSTVYEKFGFLEPGTEVAVLGRSHDWWQIDYGGEAGYVFGEIVTPFEVDGVPEVEPPALPSPTIDQPVFQPAPVWAIDEPRWIDVDLSEQRLTAYEGQTPVQSYLVSTGLPATPTPEGQFRIWIKLRYDDMAGPGYYLEDVPWVMYFYQGYGLHGVWWHANFGHQMSHGCVNQPNDMAEWLFNFADVGTLVNVHE